MKLKNKNCTEKLNLYGGPGLLEGGVVIAQSHHSDENESTCPALAEHHAMWLKHVVHSIFIRDVAWMKLEIRHHSNLRPRPRHYQTFYTRFLRVRGKAMQANQLPNLADNLLGVSRFPNSKPMDEEDWS